MVDKFMNELPFASLLTTRTGQLTGLPEHAQRLLDAERMLLVFPEGVKGTAKLYKDRYSLVDFGTGFMRLALEKKTPIIPVAFLGGGDAVPTVANAYGLGKLLGLPYLPITPYGVAIPLPVKLEVYYGEPLYFEGTGNEDDEVVAGYVDQVKRSIATMLDAGRKRRRPARRAARTGAAAVRVLIPGIAGALGRKVARLLLERGHEVIGIDARPWSGAPAEIDMHVVDIRKRAAEDVFRKRRPGHGHPHGHRHLAGRQRRGAQPHQPRRHARGLRSLPRPRRRALRLRRPPHLLRRWPGRAAAPHRGRAAHGDERLPRAVGPHRRRSLRARLRCGASPSSSPPSCGSATRSGRAATARSPASSAARACRW